MGGDKLRRDPKPKQQFAARETCPNPPSESFHKIQTPFGKIRETVADTTHDQTKDSKSKTLIKHQDLRYDYQKTIPSGGKHFGNYAVQANLEAKNPYIKGLADKGNGTRKTPTNSRVLDGSTVASVSVQQGTR